MCYICQEHESKEGHETKWCPKNICKKCGQNGHTKIVYMSEMEDLPYPNEILNKIVSFLNIKDLEKISKVSKKCSELCLLPNPKLKADSKKNTNISCNLCAKRIEVENYYHCSLFQCNEANICEACFTSEGTYKYSLNGISRDFLLCQMFIKKLFILSSLFLLSTLRCLINGIQAGLCNIMRDCL